MAITLTVVGSIFAPHRINGDAFRYPMLLKTVQPTWFKRKTTQSSDLDDREKYSVDGGIEIAINWYKLADDQHYLCELARPVYGFFNWYVFRPHVQIDGEPLSDRQELLSKTVAERIFGRAIAPEDHSDLNNCLALFEINTPRRIAAFCSQIGHESGGLRWRKELASGWAYEGRKDLGNTKAGYGPKFKGAGFLQVTGYYNYKKLMEATRDKRVMLGVDYVADKYPFTSAGVWWRDNKMNSLVDSGVDIDRIGARVNGKYLPNGYLDRRRYWERACKDLNVQ